MKLCIGTVSARGDVRIEYVQGLVGVLQECAARNIETRFVQFTGALVEDARNMMASRFLETNADALLMIDDDIFVDRRVFQRMLEVKRGIVGCYYPQRALEIETFAEGIRQGLRTDEAAEAANPLVGPDPDAASSSAMTEVEWIGSGVLLIRRAALMHMIECGTVTKERFRTPQDTAEIWNFFSRLQLGDGIARSEDVSFCLKARESGIPIFAYKGPGVLHIGNYQFGQRMSPR